MTIVVYWDVVEQKTNQTKLNDHSESYFVKVIQIENQNIWRNIFRNILSNYPIIVKPVLSSHSKVDK